MLLNIFIFKCKLEVDSDFSRNYNPIFQVGFVVHNVGYSSIIYEIAELNF